MSKLHRGSLDLVTRWVVIIVCFAHVAVSRLLGSDMVSDVPRLAKGAVLPASDTSAKSRIMKSTHVYVKNSAAPESQSLDLYVPPQTAPGAKLPMMVYVHGGGMAKGNKGNLKGHEVAFPKAGFITACINYRKSDPDATGANKIMYPDHVEDLAAAIAWLYYNAKEIGGDPNRIYLMGHSAGAALAALVATDEQFLAKYRISLSALKGVVCNDGGFYDLMERAKRPQSRRVIENAYGTDQKVWKMASPSSHVSAGKNIPPFFLNFTTLPKELMAESFARQLTAAGVPVTVFSSLGRDHEEVNFAVSIAGDPLNVAVFRFLAEHGSGKQTQLHVPAEGTPAPQQRGRAQAAIRNLLKGLSDRI